MPPLLSALLKCHAGHCRLLTAKMKTMPKIVKDLANLWVLPRVFGCPSWGSSVAGQIAPVLLHSTKGSSIVLLDETCLYPHDQRQHTARADESILTLRPDVHTCAYIRHFRFHPNRQRAQRCDGVAFAHCLFGLWFLHLHDSCHLLCQPRRCAFSAPALYSLLFSPILSA